MLNRLIRDVRRSALFRVVAIFLASSWAVVQIIDALIDNEDAAVVEAVIALARARAADEQALAEHSPITLIDDTFDPELQPRVRRAQERINALRPDRG